MTKVLFICLGNICRSPLAEGVFAHLVKEAGLESQISCDSAGTAAYHIGAPPDERSIAVANQYGIRLNHRGRQLHLKDYTEFDYILVMDKENYRHAVEMQKKAGGKAQVQLFRDYDEEMGKGDVPDPYYGNLKDFELVYQMVLRCGKSFLNRWQTQKL